MIQKIAASAAIFLRLYRHKMKNEKMVAQFRATMAENTLYIGTLLSTMFQTACQKGVTQSMEEILVAIITGGVTLMGVLMSNNKAQAVTETKIEELTREVREHNHFAKRMPVVEEQIKVINHRLTDLEEGEK